MCTGPTAIRDVHYLDVSTPKIGVAIARDNSIQSLWTAEEVSHIFSRIVIQGLLDLETSVSVIEHAARKSAHYGRLALADREVREQGWAAVRWGFGGGQ